MAILVYVSVVETESLDPQLKNYYQFVKKLLEWCVNGPQVICNYEDNTLNLTPAMFARREIELLSKR